jgi:hypothetical protein
MGVAIRTEGSGGGTASISVSGLSLSAAPDPKGLAPLNGYFASFTATVTDVSSPQGFVVDPSDFYLEGSDGTRYTLTSGNSASAAGSHALGHVSVEPGQSISGTLVIDESSAHGWVVYAPQGHPTDTWWF